MDGDVCKCLCKPGTTGLACEQGTEAEGQQGGCYVSVWLFVECFVFKEIICEILLFHFLGQSLKRSSRPLFCLQSAYGATVISQLA